MKIEQLKLSEHKLFIDTDIVLSNPEQGENVKTVIIGPNGTGKSSFLSCVCDIFLCELSVSPSKKKKIVNTIGFKYELKLSDGDIISDSSDNKLFEISKILAVTNSYKDKFYFPTKNGVKNTPKYVYLGLRSATNNIFFSNVNDNIFKYLVNIIFDKKKKKSAIKILNELNFKKSVGIVIKKGKNYNKFLEKNNTKSSLSDGSLNRFLSSDYFFDNENDIFSTIIDFENKKYPDIYFSLDDENVNDYILFLEKTLKLIDARILSVDTLSLFSHDGYNINDASSGEFNILRVMLSIIANIDNNSLILIDEPEISLHPNWQIEFCRLLDLALENFRGCHTIIATHSHFILSNLSQLSSTIISMQMSSLNRKVYLQNTLLESFGMSPENTLYTFFGITGYNNKYFEQDLRVLFDYISNNKSSNFEIFKNAFERLSRFKFDETNPIKKTLQVAENIINKEHA
ncbi:AAA family ATPase [Proteus mirabilis]|uniref:AAA family ATPase n=3 Tax=Proteus mirabilis TaxID=584 RepID=UPI0016271A81|nr:AAA family ATPase [Proteus mirabilis]EKW4023969.1 AAA family ATPase [Proteus mirabilis]MBB6658523.1 AAA family ATPase [Proteus mirabilis]MBG2713790.1 AAA family ATPase [Proteus mirabilis]MBI6274045.1 AAA family ATPase [Proteus mirabilis]HDU8345109.1 AAA family ATPase [Proteus mirabilis]